MVVGAGIEREVLRALNRLEFVKKRGPPKGQPAKRDTVAERVAAVEWLGNPGLSETVCGR
jgi:hypothetical protein